jgi:hypothetical protein
VTDIWAFTYAASNGLLGLVAGAAAIVLLVVGRRQRVTLALAAFLAISSMDAFAVAGLYLARVVGWPGYVRVSLDLWNLASIPAAFLQVLFVTYAIDTKATRPLRNAWTRVGLVGISILGFATPLIAPLGLFYTPDATRASGYAFTPVASAWLSVAVIDQIPAALYSTICSIMSMRERPLGSPARRRARAYFIAFLVCDASTVIGQLANVPDVLNGAYAPGTEFIAMFVSPLAFAFFVLLLARGVLRENLFDLDLKLKWTLRRGALVGTVLVVFFVATAIAEQFLQGYGFVVGGVAIGLLLFAIRPVERAIDRLADRAMPKTTGTPEYVAFRKLEVYKAAVESAHETGGITQRERLSLDRLRAKLSIAEADAASIEADVTGLGLAGEVSAA